MHSLILRAFACISLLVGLSSALPHFKDSVNAINSATSKNARSADTCADPSLTQTIYQVFNGADTLHGLNFRALWENLNSRAQAIVWGDLQPSFNLWPTQEDFTFPLFQFSNTGTPELIYAVGTDPQTPPVISGFVFNGIVGFVYNTQVCGSVPLLSADLSAFTDHYFTTDPFEHNLLLANGWVDSGVVAFVLPVGSS